jgi:aminopeptidase N
VAAYNIKSITIFLFCLLGCAASVSYAQTVSNPPAPNTAPNSNFTCRHLQHYVQTSKIEQDKQQQQQQKTVGYDVFYWTLNLQINPNVRYISGYIATHFTVTAVSGLDTLILDCSNALHIDSVQYQNQNIAFDQPDSVTLRLFFAKTLPQKSQQVVTIYYAGTPLEGQGFRSFVQEEHKGIPIIWTLSEPYGARDWWPTKQALNDKADSIDLYVTAPATYRVAGNGLLHAETYLYNNNALLKTTHWKHKYPIAAYLVAFAITNYTWFETPVLLPNGDTLPVLHYVYPEYLQDALVDAQATTPLMQLYCNLFENYPFANEKYGHAQFNWGGGMEHQTMSFMTNLNFELTAHELAHQWFGNKITCGSWPEIWLNEGFATFLTGLSYEHLFDGYWWPVWKNNQVKGVLKEPAGSVWATDTLDLNRLFNGRLTYTKGGMLLHSLRWHIGDEALFTAIKNYLADPNLAYGYGSTAAFQSHAEAACGCSLGAYFDDWFWGRGYPIYTANWFTAVNNDTTVILQLWQTPSDTTMGFFEGDVPVVFKNGDQKKSFRLPFAYSGQKFTLTMPFKPDTAAFDPDLWLAAEWKLADLSGFNPKPFPDKLASSTAHLLIDDQDSYEATLVFPEEWNITQAAYQTWMQKKKLQIFNALGQPVLFEITAEEDQKITIRLPKNQLPGIYFIRIAALNLPYPKQAQVLPWVLR